MGNYVQIGRKLFDNLRGAPLWDTEANYRICFQV
jgi:hypothetical protein